MSYLTTGTTIDLDIELVKEIKDSHTSSHRRAWAASELIADLERQLTPEERKQIEVKDEETG